MAWGADENIVYFDRADVLWRKPVRSGGGSYASSATPRSTEASPTARRVGPKVADDTYADPITGESMLTDWEFEIIIAAVIGDQDEHREASAKQRQEEEEEGEGDFY